MRGYDYIIADVCLRSDRDLVELGLNGFKPFAVECDIAPVAATISITDGDIPTIDSEVIATSHLSETDSEVDVSTWNLVLSVAKTLSIDLFSAAVIYPLFYAAETLPYFAFLQCSFNHSAVTLPYGVESV